MSDVTALTTSASDHLSHTLERMLIVYNINKSLSL